MVDAPGAQPPAKSGGSRSRGRGLLRIALIDARPLMREGMTRWLKAIKRCHISCFSSAADFFRASTAEEGPNAIVLSTGSGDMADRDTLAVVEELAGKVPDVPIIVLSDRDGEAALEIVRRGVRAYIPTTLDAPVARAALELVMAGGYFIPATMLIDRSALREEHQPDQSAKEDVRYVNSDPLAYERSLRVLLEQRSNGKRFDALTSREAEVLACIQQGKPNKVIAFELNIRESTVKVHVGHLMRKLNAANRTQLAVCLSPDHLALTERP